VGQPGLLKEHRDLVAVRRAPVIKVDHGGAPILLLWPASRERCDCMDFATPPFPVNGGGRREAKCDQLTRPFARSSAAPASVTLTTRPKPATVSRATRPRSAASSQIVSRGQDVFQAPITSE